MSWLLKSASGSYLERTPYDGSWGWLAGCVQHATPMTRSLAGTFQDYYQAKGQTCAVIVDPMGRAAFAEPETPWIERAEHATRDARELHDAANAAQFEARR